MVHGELVFLWLRPKMLLGRRANGCPQRGQAHRLGAHESAELGDSIALVKLSLLHAHGMLGELLAIRPESCTMLG